MRYKVTENVVIFCSLPQGETNRFIKSFIYKSDKTFFLGGDGSLPLTHVSKGVYASSAVFTMPEGSYKILHVPFLDAGFTVPDDLYGTKEEDLEIFSDAAALDLSGIQSSIDVLASAVLTAEFNVSVDEDQTILEIEVE